MSSRTNRPFSSLIGPFNEDLRSELKEKALELRTDTEYGDLYLVFPGLGTPRYIAESGTVFLDGDWTDDTIVGLRPAGLSETLACYAFTSDRFAIPALRALLPIKPDGASQCNRCEDANGWMRLPTVDGGTHQILCGCSGLGWLPKAPWELHPDEVTWFLQNSPDLSDVLERAQLALDHKQYAVASECSRYVLRRDLENSEALEVLGEANFALGNL